MLKKLESHVNTLNQELETLKKAAAEEGEDVVGTLRVTISNFASGRSHTLDLADPWLVAFGFKFTTTRTGGTVVGGQD